MTCFLFFFFFFFFPCLLGGWCPVCRGQPAQEKRVRSPPQAAEGGAAGAASRDDGGATSAPRPLAIARVPFCAGVVALIGVGFCAAQPALPTVYSTIGRVLRRPTPVGVENRALAARATAASSDLRPPSI